MIKSILLFAFLFASTVTLANSESENPDTKKIQKSVEIVEPQKQIELSSPLVVELPEAVLRLHDLEKTKFQGETVYTHVPLELAKIKSPVKTV